MSDQTAIAISTLVSKQQAGSDGFKRIAVDAQQWSALGYGCSNGLHDFSSIWVDGKNVSMALIDRDNSTPVICTLKTDGESYPSIGRMHPPALRLERAMRDLYGITPVGITDDRPWLDHGLWPNSNANEKAKAKNHGGNAPYDHLPVEGEGLHQIPVGPVHAGIIEPGHFRFTCNGEAVVRLEQRLGYVHKGTQALCVGKSIDDVARLMGRVSGDSTVAYAFAYARAVESACAIEVPTRATYLRAIMSELERISHHVNDFGAICNDASAVAINARCMLLREHVVQLANRCFGHRFMMDKIIPGGVAQDVSDEGVGDITRVLDALAKDFATVLSIYDGSPSIMDRTATTGIVKPHYAAQFAAGGHVGRASGRDFDCRRDTAYAPYDSVNFDVQVRQEGDVDARARVRAQEITQSISIILQLLAKLEPGPIHTQVKAKSACVGAALAESFRGDVFITVRLDDSGNVAHCHARDASWFQWPLLETCVENNIVADFPLCNKSFNCSYSGHDI